MLEKAYYKYNNIEDYEFVLGKEFPYIKVWLNGNRYNANIMILLSEQNI